MICPSLVDNWYEWSNAVIDDRCPSCGSDRVALTDVVHVSYFCSGCKTNFTSDESEESEVVGRVYKTIQYKAEQHEEGQNIIITHSPYYTWAMLCSPCYPNAGDIDSSIAAVIDAQSGYKTYCFGHNWFENGIAPYPLIRVSDNRVMSPPAQRRNRTRQRMRQREIELGKSDNKIQAVPMRSYRPINLDF